LLTFLRHPGSGIAPFFPITIQDRSNIALPLHVFLFVVRMTIVVPFALLYFLVLAWVPLGSLGKKAALWVLLGVPGIWWIDLAVDGVKKGSLAKTNDRLPQPGSVIAASHTSPIDALYLAAVFDPIFTQSYPDERKVRRITLWQAMLNALLPPTLEPPKGAKLVELSTLVRDKPDRCIAVFPESTTTNGRGILRFTPSLLAVPSETKIFPVSLRYTPADICTPIPGAYLGFLWNLCSQPTHCVRVRIAEPVHTDATSDSNPPRTNSYVTNLLDDLHKTDPKRRSNEEPSVTEKTVLDKIAEALARLGRVKRLGLAAEDKTAFLKVWLKKR